MKKVELVAAMQELVNETKLPKEAREKFNHLIEEMNKKKSSSESKRKLHPPILDEEGNIIQAWCKYHQTYEPIENMVVSNGKPKGYCKASSSKSNKLRNELKKVEDELLNKSLNGEDTKELAEQIKNFKDTLHSPENYDLESDWSEFNKPKETKKSKKEIKEGE